MRKQMNLVDVMKKDHYRSIIYLLEYYQEQFGKKAKKGLNGIVGINRLAGLK